MHIICNNKPRQMLCLLELSDKIRAEFDYIDDAGTPRIVQYRGAYYDVFDTQRIEPDSGRAHHMGWAMRVHPGSPLARFDAITSESFFSGVLFRLADGGSCIVGRYYG